MRESRLSALRNQTRCKFCDSLDLHRRENQSRVELVCRTCDKINQTAFKPIDPTKRTISDLPLFRTAVASCSHCPELDRVLTELEKLERELHVIVRAIGGAR
jgi:phage FluMu protein Com